MDFHLFLYLEFFWNFLTHFNFCSSWIMTTGILHEDTHAFFASILIGTKNICNRNCSLPACLAYFCSPVDGGSMFHFCQTTQCHIPDDNTLLKLIVFWWSENMQWFPPCELNLCSETKRSKYSDCVQGSYYLSGSIAVVTYSRQERTVVPVLN
jgi:hypothetical protein